MKKGIFISILAIGISSISFAQITESCLQTQIETSDDAAKSEPCVLEFANFITSQSLHFNSVEFPIMKREVLRWINRTMNYTVDINRNITALCTKKNENLLPVFHASLAKAALTGSTNFHRQAVLLLAEYIKDEKNQVKQTGAVKNFLKTVDSGNFAMYYK